MIQNPLPEDRVLRAGPSADPPDAGKHPAVVEKADETAAQAVIAVGGDARQITVIRSLCAAGCRVAAVGLSGAAGLPAGVRLLRSLSAADDFVLSSAPRGAGCILLLPLPVSRDGRTVFCPLDPEARVPFSDVEEAASRLPGVRVLGGCLPEALADRLCARLGSDRVTDYYTLEPLLLRNARLTAEGAIMTAMEVTDTALIGSRAAVIGYGRIGQYLSRLLIALGVRVTVCARRAESRAAAEGDGCGVLGLSGGRGALTALCRGYDVIYNTVPAPLFDADLLDAIDPDTRLIDLASYPGGVGGPSCMRVIRAPSLPGRYAPRTAGKIVAETVLSLIGKGAGSVPAQAEGKEVPAL